MREVCGDDFRLIAIDGVPELEAAYRELIPVVEVDGKRVFTYHVHANALRERLGQA